MAATEYAEIPTLGRAERDPEVRIESALLTAGYALVFVLHVAYAFHHRSDSDEPQHLHVVWARTQGLVQYRDFFDNHAPLFHMLMAPLVGAWGARPDALVLARLVMIPLVGLSLYCVYRIGRDVHSERAGRWGALLTALYPTFMLTSAEFRTDILWMTAWLAALAALLSGERTPRRAFLGGLLLGATFATSLKSVLLLSALALGAILTWVLGRRAQSKPTSPRNRSLALAGGAGFVVVPAAILVAFAGSHALSALLACTIGHNVVPGLGSWRAASLRPLWLPGALLVLAIGARAMLRDASQARRRLAIMFVTAGGYIALLEGLWPLLTAQDYLPFIPLAALLITIGVLSTLGWLERELRWVPAARLGTACLVLVASVELVSTQRLETAFADHDASERGLLTAVLRDTRPGEPIVDLKGETVFRPRPSYTVLEGVTKARIDQGLLPDRIADDVMRTRTHFAVPDDDAFPARSRGFLVTHFVPLGPLRVLGAAWEAPIDGGPRNFDVSYRESFTVVADGATAAGLLDGTALRSPRVLDPGTHTYAAAPGERSVTVVWTDALQREGLRASLLRSATTIDLRSRLLPSDRILVIAPHPDDEVLSTGGVLRSAAMSGAALRILYLTDGENNPWAQRATEQRWSIGPADRERWGRLREHEAITAIECLGVTPAAARFLHLPDQRLTDLLVQRPAAVVSELKKEIEAWQPTVVFAPSIVDRHPDHNAAGVFIRMALAGLPPEQTSPVLLNYVVHPCGYKWPKGERWTLTLGPEDLATKRRAILCYASQLALRRRFMMRFARSTEQFELAGLDTQDDSRGQPLHLLSANDQSVSFEFDASVRTELDPPRLVLVDEGSDRVTVMCMRLPLHAARRPIVADDGRTLGDLRTERHGNDLLVSIRSAALAGTNQCFAKLDEPLDRKLGFFDAWPWLDLTPADISAARVPTHPRSGQTSDALIRIAHAELSEQRAP